MTVRCDVCGTENRDKAMFCRGCAGKLPAFAITKKPSVDGTDAQRASVPSVDASELSGATHVLRSERPGRSFFHGIVKYVVLLALLTVVLGASIVWFIQSSPKDETRVAPILHGSLPDDPLPASDTTSTESKDKPSPTIPTDASATGTSSEAVSTDVLTATPSRSTGRRPASTAQGGGRASDPRIGCEHLFFAFAARCEANHCQQPAYARHPRCDAVREQRKRDDARRNSMPLS